MKEIYDRGEFVPPSHGELSIPLLSTSLNDNMLKFFSDGSTQCGFGFDVEDINVLVLPPLYYALLTAYESSTDFWWEAVRKNPEHEDIAIRLHYSNGSSVDGISPKLWEDLEPAGVDAIALPGWDCQMSYNHEAELAFNHRGCRKLWSSVTKIILHNEWHEINGINEGRWLLEDTLRGEPHYAYD
jgi:hypothetical protein